VHLVSIAVRDRSLTLEVCTSGIHYKDAVRIIWPQFARFEVYTAGTIKITVLHNMTLYIPVDLYQHLQGEKKHEDPTKRW
jgi:hypothetical protein